MISFRVFSVPAAGSLDHVAFFAVYLFPVSCAVGIVLAWVLYFAKQYRAAFVADSSAGVESRPGRCCDWATTSPRSTRDPRGDLRHAGRQPVRCSGWRCGHDSQRREGQSVPWRSRLSSRAVRVFVWSDVGVKSHGKAFEF
jgi:hypothetical protein